MVSKVPTQSEMQMQKYYDGLSNILRCMGLGWERRREWKPITHPFLALVSPAKQHIEIETDGMETVASCQGERDIWEQVEAFAENLWADAQFGWCSGRTP